MTPLVLIHGFPLSKGAWDEQMKAFGESRRVIAPDLRGLGDSPPASDAPVSMDDYARDIRRLLEDLGTGSVVLGGHSMGGYVALAFARLFPELLKGLALVATRSGPDTPEGAAGRRATAEKVRASGPGVVIDAMAPKMLAAGNTDLGLAERVRGLMAASRPAGLIGALLGMAERPDATPQVAKIVVPTLVVSGTSDVLIPHTESEKLAAAIPGAFLRLIPNAGHLVALEKPADFNAALQELLSRVDGA